MAIQTVHDEFTTNAGIGSAIARHARTYDIDIAPICSALDLDLELLQNLTARISLDRLCRLLETCAVLSNDEAFGLKCAEVFTPGASGSFGYGILASPTVRHYVQFMGDHTPHLSHTSHCGLDFTDTEAVVSWTFSPLIVNRDQYVDMVTAIHIRNLRRMVGEDIAIAAIHLERPKPRNVAVFRERLTRKVNFGARMNGLSIPTMLLDRLNPRGDENLFKLMDQQCRALHMDGMTDGEFMSRVRRYLRLRIAEPALSLEDIAAYFRLSERTFQRRLAELGATLNELRDEERRSLSLKLLKESDLSISAICYRLGYSAPSAFTRSVHRWFGMSPRHLRNAGGGCGPEGADE